MPILVSRWLLAATCLWLPSLGDPASLNNLWNSTPPLKRSRRGSRAAHSGLSGAAKGAGPFPAVVLLHSCLGLPQPALDRAGARSLRLCRALRRRLRNPGLKETCTRRLRRCPARRLWRARVPVAPPFRRPRADRRGRLFARGRHGAQDRIRPIRGSQAAGFKAAAAFYPPCANEADDKSRIPTLILVGSSDAVTPAADCERLAKAQGRIPPSSSSSIPARRISSTIPRTSAAGGSWAWSFGTIAPPPLVPGPNFASFSRRSLADSGPAGRRH